MLRHFLLTVLLLMFLFGSSQSSLQSLQFVSTDTKILPGKSIEKGYDASVKPDDTIGNLALISLFYQNGCYTDGRYNHNDFKVERGHVLVNGQKLDAYKLYEPARKATEFLASQHAVYYKIDNVDLVAYELLDGQAKKLMDLPRSSKLNNGYSNASKEISASLIKGSRTIFFAPKSLRVSMFDILANGVEAVKIKDLEVGSYYHYRFDIEGEIFNSNKENYTRLRQFFPFETAQGSTIIWQDQKNFSLYKTDISTNKKAYNTKKIMPLYGETTLRAATNDDQGNLYCVTCSGESGRIGLTLYKFNSSGSLIMKKSYDTSKQGMNIYSCGSWMSDLEYSNGKLALMIARTMHKSSDGLNHQGGIATIFNSADLTLMKNLGQTSGHSFDNYLTKNSDGRFLGIDLGDNYPRGVHLHKFDDTRRDSRVVYTFKTEHGTRAKSPAGVSYPKYDEISKGGYAFYKWSNDNGTYSELGGVVEVADGYLVFFTGEPSPTGKSIDNSRINLKNPDPRNVGFVKVRKDFENASGSGNVVTDDLILSSGASESGGFYTFGGWFSEQRNTGVNWLTKYSTTDKMAQNLKVVSLQNGNTLLIWERAKDEDYDRSSAEVQALLVDKNGRKLSSIMNLGKLLKLHRRDDPILVGNEIIIPLGNPKEKKLEMAVIRLN